MLFLSLLACCCSFDWAEQEILTSYSRWYGSHKKITSLNRPLFLFRTQIWQLPCAVWKFQKLRLLQTLSIYIQLCSFNSIVSSKEHTSAMMWMCVTVFLLWMRSGRCTDKANTSDLIEYTAADFYEKLHSGKMMFIYFEHQGRPLTAHAISAVLLYICHRSHAPHYQACDVKHASVLNKCILMSSTC